MRHALGSRSLFRAHTLHRLGWSLCLQCFIKRTLRPEFIGGPAMVLEVRMKHVKASREFKLKSETLY